MSYVKPHGALYNRVVDDEEQARAVLAGSGDLPVLGLPGSVLLALAERWAAAAHPEGFPDRGYTDRTVAGWCRATGRARCIHDPAEIAARARADGPAGQVDSVCVHGDGPAAVRGATAVRAALEAGRLTAAELRMRFLPVGADALLVEVDDTAAATALYADGAAASTSRRPTWCRPRGPCCSTAWPTTWRPWREVAGWSVHARPTCSAGRRRSRCPRCTTAPDLDGVARLWDMTTREVVATHTACAIVVAFCGFAPGFAYCTGLPEELRRAAAGEPAAPASRPVRWAWPASSPASTRPPRPAAGSSSGAPTSCCGTTPGTSPRRWRRAPAVRFVEVSR